MAETVMDPATEEEKQPLQSEGAVQKEGEESQPKEPDFCLESIPHSDDNLSFSPCFMIRVHTVIHF